MRLETRLTLMCLSVGLLSGQYLSVPPSTASLNTAGAFAVFLNAPSDQAPLGLQWDLLIPPVISVRVQDITIGKEARAVGKSITCALRQATKNTRLTRYTCIVAGGRVPLSDGPVAQVQYRAQWDLKGDPALVEIENVLGVSRDLQPIRMPDVEVSLRVH